MSRIIQPSSPRPVIKRGRIRQPKGQNSSSVATNNSVSSGSRVSQSQNDRFSSKTSKTNFGRVANTPQRQTSTRAARGLSNSSATQYADKSAGEAMRQAIDLGIRDFDGQGAGKEFADFSKFAKENPDKLSAEAKGAMRVYTEYANKAKEAGKSGISLKEFGQMKKDMAKVKYADEGAGQAIEKLKSSKGTITAKQRTEAVSQGTQDADKEVVGKEYADFAKFAEENAQCLSPKAHEAMETYKSWAEAAQAQGQNGLSDSDFASMLKEMGPKMPGRQRKILDAQRVAQTTSSTKSPRGGRIIQPGPKK